MKSKNELIETWNQEIQRAGTLTVLHTNAVASRIGLSATEFEAVDIIRRNQPITAGQLAVYCGLTTGATTGLIDRLEASHCVARTKDPSDRRKVLLVPIKNSDRARRVWALYQPMSKGFSHIAAKYSADELNFLISSQRQLNDMAQEVTASLRDIPE